MNNSKWAVFAVALGMIAVTAGALQQFRKQPHLGPPGVRVGHVTIYDEKGNVAAKDSVVLPDTVLGVPSVAAPITTVELKELPQDTTFGRRVYTTPDKTFRCQTSVVLMGTDHTSIHQPQYCLYAQNWTITNTERISLPMDAPFSDIPAVKLVGSQQLPNGQTVDCIYVYWFVSGNNVTAEEGSRLWSMWKTVLQKGQMERWAYISYFVPCVPEEEQATFQRLAKFIRASAPQFQTVTGKPTGPLAAMTAQK